MNKFKNLKDLANIKDENEWECSNCDMMNYGNNPYCRDCESEESDKWEEREELKKEIKEEILEELKNGT